MLSMKQAFFVGCSEHETGGKVINWRIIHTRENPK